MFVFKCHLDFFLKLNHIFTDHPDYFLTRQVKTTLRQFNFKLKLDKKNRVEKF
jgi:hypothetical protein